MNENKYKATREKIGVQTDFHYVLTAHMPKIKQLYTEIDSLDKADEMKYDLARKYEMKTELAHLHEKTMFKELVLQLIRIKFKEIDFYK